MLGQLEQQQDERSGGRLHHDQRGRQLHLRHSQRGRQFGRSHLLGRPEQQRDGRVGRSVPLRSLDGCRRRNQRRLRSRHRGQHQLLGRQQPGPELAADRRDKPRSPRPVPGLRLRGRRSDVLGPEYERPGDAALLGHSSSSGILRQQLLGGHLPDHDRRPGGLVHGRFRQPPARDHAFAGRPLLGHADLVGDIQLHGSGERRHRSRGDRRDVDPGPSGKARAAYRRHRAGRQCPGSCLLDRAGRRQRDHHRLHSLLVTGRVWVHHLGRHELPGQRPDQRPLVFVHGHGNESQRNR